MKKDKLTLVAAWATCIAIGVAMLFGILYISMKITEGLSEALTNFIVH